MVSSGNNGMRTSKEYANRTSLNNCRNKGAESKRSRNTQVTSTELLKLGNDS
jgi:hypothetical protein